MQTFYLFLIFYFGACIGSFLNVVIWRLPLGRSLGGRSACPRCGRELSWKELFPLFSFLFLRGKCAGCFKKISWRYFIIEILVGIMFLLAWQLILPTDALGILLLARSWLVIALMVVVFAVDLEHYVILDKVIVFGLICGAALNLFLDVSQTGDLPLHGYFARGVLGALLAVLPFFALWYVSQGKWLGFGDVKLAVLLGVLLGWPLVGVNLFLAVMLGGVVSVFLLAARKKGLKSAVPFGAFLSPAAITAVFYGQSFLRWYLSLLGF